jgi:hypothetical protein
MPILPKVSGTYKGTSNLFAKVDGGWKKAKGGWVKVDGTWRQFFAAELTDTFNRADTTNTLGTSDSGLAWEIISSQWRINGGFANTTGTKTDYPLARIDLGIFDFDASINELSPGMGLVFNYTDSNNWWAVYPYYNRVSTPYTYCVSGRNESYCIANCTTPAGYNTVCYGVETPGTQTCVNETVPTGCSTVCSEPTTGCASAPFCTNCYYVPGVTTCTSRTEEFSCCIKTCNACRDVCVKDTVCIREDGRTRCYPTTTCTPVCSDICCDRDTCTRTVQDCTTSEGSTVCGCECPISIPGGCTTSCTGSTTQLVCSTSPSTCSTGYQQVPYYNCCQSGSRFICEVDAVGYTNTDYFYIRVIRKQAGTISVVSDTPVNERWTALKATRINNVISITAYNNNAYTGQVGTATVSSTSAGTGYGIIGAPSNFEDGRNIGSISVKAYGQ